MNRRTVLRSGGVGAAVGLAGCLDAFREHFEGGLQSPVPVEVHNEGDRYYNVQLEAYERGTNRQTYEEGFAVSPNERVSSPHLEGVEQRLRVVRTTEGGEEDVIVEEAAVGTDAQVVLIRIRNDGVDVEVRREEGDDGPETE